MKMLSSVYKQSPMATEMSRPSTSDIMEENERFPEVDEDDIERIMENSVSDNTNKVINMAKKVLHAFIAEKEVDMDPMTATETEICAMLRKFYASTRNQKGEYYRKKTMVSIRYGLQKHFVKTRGIDIVNGTSFKECNEVFNAMLKKLKSEGKGKINHKQPLSKDDLTTLYSYLESVQDTPAGLQNKVFIDFMLYFCNRGRENLRYLKKDDFQICGDDQHRYIVLKDMKTKNHIGDITDENDSQGGRIYADNTNTCPYSSFVKYISKLNPDCDSFWQRPKGKFSTDSITWYDNINVGRNTLGDKMKTLSTLAKLSTTYTNHCLRATSVTLLDNSGFEARHIMAVSGHKSETSIRSYSRTNDAQKRSMATVITSALTEIGNTESSHTESVKPANSTHPNAKKLKMNSNPISSASDVFQELRNAEYSDNMQDIIPVQQNQFPKMDSDTSTGTSHELVQDEENYTNAGYDFLELTDSQENAMLEEFTLAGLPSNNISCVNENITLSSTRTYRSQQPVLNFNNIGTINIHNHYH